MMNTGYKRKRKNHFHGACRHPMFHHWHNMMTRCYNFNCKAFHNYGGRGIKVHSEWIENPKMFINYILSLPHAQQPGHSIDRINNDGNYEPGNLRWSNDHIQAINQRQKGLGGSVFKGVYFDKQSKKWEASIVIHKKKHYLGRYDTESEALNIRNQYIKDNKLTEYKIQ